MGFIFFVDKFLLPNNDSFSLHKNAGNLDYYQCHGKSASDRRCLRQRKQLPNTLFVSKVIHLFRQAWPSVKESKYTQVLALHTLELSCLGTSSTFNCPAAYYFLLPP